MAAIGANTTVCTSVSVLGDATYCITGRVCGGKSADGACPRPGAKASANCAPGIPSWTATTRSCVLNSLVVCTIVSTQPSFGCVAYPLAMSATPTVTKQSSARPL
ncbi:hypothetical protein SPRG_05569 [Saprolegnia parasitica CBS 223.65]|uniref:CBM1 domain-containing protein n=1 Tax=Saprolegnia parasitica (strain CBS 223.65) TaxID=695850 RepID=A0A067CSW9_SAPPC|nr:hypothetical protein SPRG_05569 [Saprolegnia parasitica CBS 223.65]KDO29616.1 hypothetical protein SPRG_05569 [Saprolegnia parasitica CBS 223.65]|eukprot:XP_012199676.1 hypothetical protein SPRG_05569 [Saprolegnia parasitica CBS 223.65]